jgi:hypothetical protein
LSEIKEVKNPKRVPSLTSERVILPVPKLYEAASFIAGDGFK